MKTRQSTSSVTYALAILAAGTWALHAATPVHAATADSTPVIAVISAGVAFRYDLPEASGLRDFVLTNELRKFRFAEDYRCWIGNQSECAKNASPEKTISAIQTSRRICRNPQSELICEKMIIQFVIQQGETTI